MKTTAETGISIMSEFLPADPGVHEHHQGPETIVDGMEHSDDVHFNAAGVGLAFLGLKSYLEKGPRGSSRSLDQVPRHLGPSEQRRVDELKAQGKDPELETQMRYTREAIERGSSVEFTP